MRLLSHQTAWLLFLGASPALAVFQEFFFAGNGGNATAPRICGDMRYECVAPLMCSLESLTSKWYCCEPGNSDGPCWTGSSACGGGGTPAIKPSAQQIGCTNGGIDYCCSSQEQCTLIAKQVRICWSNQPNTIRFLNSTELNQTYSSLSSANPKATSLPVDNNQLFAMTSTTPGASSATPTSTPSSASASTAPASTSSSSTTSSSQGISGGAIGGIVVGVIGGLALPGLIAFFLWRRRKNAGKTNPHATPGAPYQSYGYQPGYQPEHPIHGAHAPYSPPAAMAQMHQPPPTDKYAHTHQAPVEVPAYNKPAEMDGGNHGQFQAGRNEL